MTKPTGLFARMSQTSLVISALAWFWLDFARTGGLQVPKYGKQLPDSVIERIAETTSKVEANERMLRDLHTGIAPRDASNVPWWHQLKQSHERETQAIERLTLALERNTQSNYEAIRSRRGGDESREARVPASPEPRSWLERLSDWLWWDAAG